MDDNFSPQRVTYTQQLIGFFTSLPVIKNISKWLAGQIGPTEEEQRNAGVYLGGEGRD